jgi:O-antigen/teichoic acid export membrane protein
MRSRAIRGTVLSIAAHGSSQVLRLGSNLVLTRLLFPEAFGVMALVRMLLNGLHMLSDVGIQPSIIQHARGDDTSFLNTAWTLQVARGLLLWMISIAIAFPFARFYEEPQLETLVPATLLAAVISGLNSTKLVTLNRQIQLGRLVLIDLVSQLAAIAAMILHAWWYRSVWALVIGALVQSGVKLLLSHVAVPGPVNRFAWDAAAVRDILSFGKWIFLSTLITFLAMRLDVVLLGKLAPMDELGVYSIAVLLGAVPRQVADRVAGLVLLPALAAAARENHEALVRSFKRARRSVLPLGALAFLGAALLAPAFFVLLYDSRYHAAGWMAQLIMVHAWFSYLQETSSRALLAVGDARALAVSNAVKLVATGAGCMIGMVVAEITGFMIGLGLGALAGHLVVIVSLMRHGVRSALPDFLYTVAGVGTAILVTWGAKLWVATGAVEPTSVVPGLVLGLLVLLPLSAWVLLRVRHEVRS